MMPGIVAAGMRRTGSAIIANIVAGAVNLESYAAKLTEATPGSWSVLSGTLPNGLHLDAATGVISGVANAANGYYTAVLRFTDGTTVTQRSITIGVGTIACLMHFDGADGSASLVDATGRAWTRYGDARLSASAPKFGSASLLLDGAGDYAYGAESGWLIGTQDFDVSAFVKPAAVTSATVQGIWSKNPGGVASTTPRLMFMKYTDGRVALDFQAWSGSGATAFSSAVVAANTWQFAAAYRKSARFGAGVNGAFGAENTDSRLGADMTISGVAGIGRFANTASPYECFFDGRIDEFKLVIGARIHVNGYVPQVPSDYPQPAPALTIRGSLPAGSAGVAYSNNTGIVISGAATSVAVTSGALPAGWAASLSGSNVVVSGPGMPAGDYTFTLTVTDAASRSASLPLTLRVV